MKRRILGVVLCLLLVGQAGAVNLNTSSQALLLMEKQTGQILYAQNEHQQLEPASVTKVMTLLLIMEAVDAGSIGYDDAVPVSAYAASMGGSQVYLAEGERITVSELLKAICVASGNDAAVAMAEYVAGSEESFVEKMNRRAEELGMKDTVFLNCTGLPAKGHVSSAYDVALMSRELILHHPDLRQYTTIWMDSLRDGTFILANTNKLIRFYDGATGLKTGSTSTAGYCVSATAERDSMELIAVVMKGLTGEKRFADAKTLLNYGFSTYALTQIQPGQALRPVDVRLGAEETVQPVLEENNCLLLEKSRLGKLEQKITLVEQVEAPVEQGQRLGELTVSEGDEVLAVLPILASGSVAKLSWGQVMAELLRITLLASD